MFMKDWVTYWVFTMSVVLPIIMFGLPSPIYSAWFAKSRLLP